MANNYTLFASLLEMPHDAARYAAAIETLVDPDAYRQYFDRGFSPSDAVVQSRLDDGIDS